MLSDPLNPTLKLRDIQTVYQEGVRQPTDSERCHTAHYHITEWVKPIEPLPPPDCKTLQQFFIRGPGHTGKCFLANTDDCGFQFIRALERAYMAGFEAGAVKKNAK